MMKRIISAICGISLLCILTSCIKLPDKYLQILVWAAGDNSLQSEVYQDMFEEFASEIKQNIQKIFYYDGNGLADAGVYTCSGGKVEKYSDKTYNDESGSIDSLKEFLGDFYDDSYLHHMFIIEGHGSSWLYDSKYGGKVSVSGKSVISTEAIANDDNPENAIAISDLAAVVRNYDFDIIGFDACNMSSIEMLYEFSGAPVNYIIASYKEEVDTGWDYSFVNQIDYTTMGRLAINVAKKYEDYYNNHYKYYDDTKYAKNLYVFDMSKFNRERVDDSINRISVKSSRVVRDNNFTYDGEKITANLVKLDDDECIKELFVYPEEEYDGLMIFLPESSVTYGDCLDDYETLNFSSGTNWLTSVKMYLEK